ncbi:TetR/AcrR family transcriptional regulator [Erythrobacter sp. Alg231-14]|uniref:TetR/AcrR family transcriptional regulator n=1 Tax=Erythrobacter sp. Alg231-14 TaxID=1922225 RepID=UPI00307C992F
MVNQKDKSATTRARLLETFRSSLLSRGLGATTVQLVLEETDLSKGALYHHFRSKDDIIEAIYVHESQTTIERAFSGVCPDEPPMLRLRDGCIAWLTEIQNQSTAAILLDIGPTALGYKKARQIEDRIGIARIRELLEEARDNRAVEIEDVQLAASFINSLVAEATLHSVRTGKDVRPYLSNAIKALLAGWGTTP